MPARPTPRNGLARLLVVSDSLNLFRFALSAIQAHNVFDSPGISSQGPHGLKIAIRWIESILRR